MMGKRGAQISSMLFSVEIWLSNRISSATTYSGSQGLKAFLYSKLVKRYLSTFGTSRCSLMICPKVIRRDED